MTTEDTQAYDETNDDNNGDDENKNLGGFSDIAEHCLRVIQKTTDEIGFGSSLFSTATFILVLFFSF